MYIYAVLTGHVDEHAGRQGRRAIVVGGVAGELGAHVLAAEVFQHELAAHDAVARRLVRRVAREMAVAIPGDRRRRLTYKSPYIYMTHVSLHARVYVTSI